MRASVIGDVVIIDDTFIHVYTRVTCISLDDDVRIDEH